MNSRRLLPFISIIILQMLFLAFPLYAAEENRETGIAFMSGGATQKGREVLNERGKGYSLKLIFSDEKGAYLSNVIVKVMDQENRTVLTTLSNGPWLLIDLPNGTYKIEASFRAERKRISRIEIEQGKQKEIHLRWPSNDGFREDLSIPNPGSGESG